LVAVVAVVAFPRNAVAVIDPVTPRLAFDALVTVSCNAGCVSNVEFAAVLVVTNVMYLVPVIAVSGFAKINDAEEALPAKDVAETVPGIVKLPPVAPVGV
jgi:hypothetical protein